MAPITRSRKFSLGLALLLSSWTLEAAELQRVQAISQIGLVPIQWDLGGEGDPNLQKLKEKLGKGFSAAVHSSNRFRVLNDELVEGLWSSQEGRQKLVNDYELEAFVSLSAIVKGDTLTLQSRIMSPNLDVYLSEMDQLSLTSSANSDDVEIRSRVEDLTYRLFNRLPVDMAVIAVQGRFITLSGGSKQNVHVNDEYQIVRPMVATISPSDGSWLSYKNQILGKAVIVEVKSLTSVAKITGLSYDNAVEVGDGAKIANVENRARFQRLAEAPKFKDSREDTTILTPMYDEKTGKTSIKSEQVEKAPASPPAPRKPAAPLYRPETSESAPRQVAAEEQAPVAEQEDDSPPFWTMFEHHFKSVNFVAAARQWSISGDASASASFQPWIFNHFAANGVGQFSDDIDYEVGASLSLGLTGTNFMGGGANARAIYKYDLAGAIPVRYARFGGDFNFETMNITDEEAGGINLMNFGGFVGLADETTIAGYNTEWNADLYLTLLSFGQVGAAGELESISGGMGYGLRGTAFVAGDPRSLEWGGGLKYGTQKLNVGNGSVTYKETTLSLNARYRF